MTAAPAIAEGSDRFDRTRPTALELAARLRRRDVSAVEVMRSTLDVIARENPDIQAFVELDTRRALRAAEQADRDLARGGALPLLLGVPTGIKDHEHVRLLGTRAGSRALKWVRWPIDGKLARRCREGGMLLVGKLATSEFTILPFVDTELAPPTRNPVDRRFYSGGSSGGSSAAVASGMLPVAPGSDGAGSIRIPAAFCGLVGFKPGRGVLFHEHRIADPVEMSAVGPIARDVRDAAALLDVLAGRAIHDGRPRHGSFLAACEVAPQKLRIRIGVRSSLTPVHPEIEAAVRRAAKALASMGHSVEEGPPLEIEVSEFFPLMARMVASVPVLPFTESMLQPLTRWMRDKGRGLSRDVVFTACNALEKRILAWFGDADVWITPTSPVLAPAVGSFDGMSPEAVFDAVVPIGAFTAGFNASGQPAVSLPAARAANGLPIGVQLIAKQGSDRRLLGLAAALEARLATEA